MVVGFCITSASDIAGISKNREAARLPTRRAFTSLGALLKCGMAGVDVRPGIDDRDYRLPA